MLVPIKWLKEYTEINMPAQEWVDGMVLSGTNLECIDYWDKEIENVVVGKIEKIEAHPNANKLVVCQVNVGDKTIQICTGATNMHEGDKVAVALDGSRVPGPLHGNPKKEGGEVITAGELRGVVSMGMMCGCQELGFPDKIAPLRDKDGLWLLDDECFVPGTPIIEALGVDEPTVDFEITPNRPDCLSMLGIARESAATFGSTVKYPETKCTKVAPEKSEDYISVEIKKPQLCPRYCCRVIKDIKIAQSPWWMQRSLMLAGMRPINNIVDISNYVMLEYGQPLHAFDINTVKGGKIIVDTAKNGDKFTTLDGVERELTEDVLMINDAEGPIAIAGIMGGLDSEITGDTKMVLVESANFNGDVIRKGSGLLRHRTEASGRFEKGIDPNLAKDACDRFCYLVELLGAGTVLTGDVDIYPNPAKNVVTEVRPSRICKVIGINIETETMISYLESLDIKVEKQGDDLLICTAPTVRQDLSIEEDYIEEVARMYGYDKIPGTLPMGRLGGGLTAFQKYRNLAKDTLRGSGVSEVMTYSFVSPKLLDKIREKEDSTRRKYVKLLNPLGEDTSVMRTEILPNILQVIGTNVSRSIPAARFFELGNTFIMENAGQEDGLPVEENYLSMAMYGEGEDFFSLKGILENLFAVLGLEPEFVAEKEDGRFHPGRCAKLVVNGKEIGTMGQIHPDVLENFDLDCNVFGAELAFDEMFKLADTQIHYQPLPKHPAITRDFALVVEEKTQVGDIEKTIKNVAGELLEDAKLFDVYRGVGILPGKKSVAFSLSYRAKDRTLKEEEVNEINTRVLLALKEEYNAALREM